MTATLSTRVHLLHGGFDELGSHGMCVGEIKEEIPNIEFNPNRLKSGLVNCRFVPLEQMEFEIIKLDISNFNSTTDILAELNLKTNIYRIILTGVRNVDIDKLKEEIKLSCDSVCEVIDNTRMEFNLEEISKQKNLKGVFTKNMIEELKKHPEDEETIMKAIEIVFDNL